MAAPASDPEKQPEDQPVTRTVSTVSNPNVRPACFRNTLHEILFVFTATMAISQSSFTTGSNQVITSVIGRDLNMNTAEIAWINASSALTAGTFLLFFGRVADMFGRRPLFIIAMGLFSVFALAAGFSKTPMTLDILNGFMGLCSAASVPPAVGTLGVSYAKPCRRKNYAFACFSAGNPLGFVFGSIFSGIATKLFSWRASYWLLAIIYLVFTIIAWFTIPKLPTNHQKLGWDAFKRFDVLGTISAIAGIAFFSSSLTLAGDAPDGWKTNYVIILLILGVFLIVGFVVWEGFFSFPLMPLYVWKDRNFSLLICTLLLGFTGFPSSNFWLSLYFQDVQKLSPLEVAVRLLPQAIAGIMVNIFAGLVLHKISNKVLMAVGSLSYTGAFILLAMQGRNSNYWAFVFPSLVLTVIGADLEFNVCNMYVMSSLPPHQQSIAGGIFNTVTKLCVTLGLGISTAIYNALAPAGTSAALSPTGSSTVIGSDADIMRPYKGVFWFSTASAACGVLLVPFLTIKTQGHNMKKGLKKGIPDRTPEDDVAGDTPVSSSVDETMAAVEAELERQRTRETTKSRS